MEYLTKGTIHFLKKIVNDPRLKRVSSNSDFRFFPLGPFDLDDLQVARPLGDLEDGRAHV